MHSMKCSELAILHAIKAINHLKPYIGQKIVKTDYSLLEKLKFKFDDIKPKTNPEFPDDYITGHHCYLSFSRYYIWLKYSIRAKDSEFSCFYTTIDVYLGEMNGNNILKSLSELSKPKKTTVKRQKYLAERIQKLKKETSTLSYELIG